MPNAVPLQVGSGGMSAGHLALGLLILGMGIIAVVIGRAVASSQGLPPELSRVRDQARGSKAEQTPKIVRLSAPAIRNGTVDIRARLGALYRDGADTSRPSATRNITDSVRASWRARTASIPGQALALIEWGVAVVVFGSVAVSTGLIIAAFSANPTYPSLDTLLHRIPPLTGNGFEFLVNLAGAFPYSDLLWALGFANAILVIDAIYHHWYLLALGCFGVAAGLMLLERRYGDALPTEQVYDRRVAGVYLAGGVLATWLVGATIDTLGNIAGIHAIGEAVGFLLAVLVGIAGTVYGAIQARQRLREVTSDIQKGGRWGVLLIGLRGAARGIRGIAILFVALYATAAIINGSLVAVATAFLAASIEVQFLVGLTVTIAAAAVAYEIRDAWPGVRQALSELFARNRVRARAFAVGVPVLAVAAAFLAAWAFHAPLVIALLLAITAGVIFRLLTLTVLKLRYRQSIRDRTTLPSGAILVEGYKLDTEAGDIPLLRIGGTHQISREGVDAALDETVTAVRQRANGDDIEPSIGSWHARSLLQFGIHSVDETEAKVREKVREATLKELRAAAGERVERGAFFESLARFPTELAEQRVAEMAPYVRDDGEYVELKDDIWARQVDGIGQGTQTGNPEYTF